MEKIERLPEEVEFVLRLKRRDTSAFSILYDNYAPALYGLILENVTEKENAERVLQDVFIHIWKNVDVYSSSKGTLLIWMLNIARKHSLKESNTMLLQIEKTQLH